MAHNVKLLYIQPILPGFYEVHNEALKICSYGIGLRWMSFAIGLRHLPKNVAGPVYLEPVLAEHS